MSTTIKKALAVIELWAERKEPSSISELSRALNMSKSNLHFHLSALCANGYVEQDLLTKKYFLTLKLWELGSRVLGKLDLRRIASPYLAGLSEATAETINLAILDHDEVLYVHRIDSPMPVRAHAPEGSRAPAYCTSTGRAMLTYGSDEVIKRVSSRIKRHTDRTISSARELMSKLHKVRQAGYAINRGEWRDSIRGVAAPILDRSGLVTAAVGLMGPAGTVVVQKAGAIGNDSNENRYGDLGSIGIQASGLSPDIDGPGDSHTT